MVRVKAIIEYEGTNYFGWQLQKEQKTVQGEIERALQTIFKQRIPVTGSGRTDTGVHARGQVAHFDIPQTDVFRLKRSLNGLLAEDIVIKSLEVCAADFHARFSAKRRWYRYYISLEPTALNRKFVWPIFSKLNLTLMQRAAERIATIEDFQSFCKAKSAVNHYRCQIFYSRWLKQGPLLIYEIAADRFLHGMVRALVGSLVAIGSGQLTLAQFETIIAKKDRRLVPQAAPAKGLILEKVEY